MFVIGTLWINEDTGDLVFSKSADFGAQPEAKVRFLAKHIANLFDEIADSEDEPDATQPESK